MKILLWVNYIFIYRMWAIQETLSKVYQSECLIKHEGRYSFYFRTISYFWCHLLDFDVHSISRSLPRSDSLPLSPWLWLSQYLSFSLSASPLLVPFPLTAPLPDVHVPFLVLSPFVSQENAPDESALLFHVLVPFLSLFHDIVHTILCPVKNNYSIKFS